MLINYMVNAFLRECNFSRHNFYFVGTMRNVSFQIIVRHKMHFPKIPINKYMFSTVCHLKHITVHDGMPRPRAKVIIIDTRGPKFCHVSTEHLFHSILSLTSFSSSLVEPDNSYT